MLAATCVHWWLATAALPAEGSPILIPSPDLAPDFEAFPRLSGSGKAFTLVNIELARRDAAALRETSGCLDSPSGWARWIVVGFAGPEFLSLTAHKDFYCEGAAHPNSFSERVTFDLSTGAAVDWTALLQPGLHDLRATGWGAYDSPTLRKIYRDRLPYRSDDLCDGFDTGQYLSFEFSLSAHSVTVSPLGYSHVERPCADDVDIGIADLTRLGVDPRLAAGLQAGHN
jgi:hypothetical protein